MPLGARVNIIALLLEFHKIVVDSGRDPSELSVTSFLIEPEEDNIRRSADAGIDRVVFGLPPKRRSIILPLLDKFLEMVNRMA